MSDPAGYLNVLAITTLVIAAGLSVLFPFTAASLYLLGRPPRKNRACRSEPALPVQVQILIPAHNEELDLGATLRSIQASVERARATSAALRVSLFVGCDSCSDTTGGIALRAGAQVVQCEFGSKWRTLNHLFRIAGNRSEWTVFVDAGADWPASFLQDLITHSHAPEMIGFAPSYRGGGRISRLYWWFEARLKGLENLAGGPVSVHGATVAYRTKLLADTLQRLDETAPGDTWLNDDVVIPLMLRLRNPGGNLLYRPDLCVRECSRKPVVSGASRRRRVAGGNVQWVRTLLRPALKQNPVVAILAARRLFRLFWAYWLFALLGTAFLAASQVRVASNSIVAFCMFLVFLGLLGGRSGAFAALRGSLESPFFLLFPRRLRSLAWK